MKKKFGAVPMLVALFTNQWFIIGVVLLIFLLPIIVGTWGLVFKILSILSSPIGNGSIPIWMLFVGGILFIWLYRKIVQTRYQNDMLRNPPGGY